MSGKEQEQTAKVGESLRPKTPAGEMEGVHRAVRRRGRPPPHRVRLTKQADRSPGNQPRQGQQSFAHGVSRGWTCQRKRFSVGNRILAEIRAVQI